MDFISLLFAPCYIQVWTTNLLVSFLTKNKPLSLPGIPVAQVPFLCPLSLLFMVSCSSNCYFPQILNLNSKSHIWFLVLIFPGYSWQNKNVEVLKTIYLII